MEKNRYLLCLLLCGFMLYFAVPRLTITLDGANGIFSIVWVLFALIVIAGNLTSLLYSPRKKVQQHQSEQMKKKHRSFY
ncbi:MAG TPA: hypothetical protein VGI04_00140 [Neobacillus sp.]|jgi:hypothetical protein